MGIPSWAKSLPWDQIRRAAEDHKLDPLLVAAVVVKESGGIALRTRFEPRSYRDAMCNGRYLVSHRDFASSLGVSEDTELCHQMTSWGLMQVMGFVAREIGHKGYLTELCQVEVGLELGCRKLQLLSQRYDGETQVISAYNQGSPRKDPRSGFYVNQKDYVDPVHRLLTQLRALE